MSYRARRRLPTAKPSRCAETARLASAAAPRAATSFEQRGAEMESVPGAQAAHKVGEFANGQVNRFLDRGEDVTNALKDVESPEIARVRAKVKLALAAAKSAASDTVSQIRTRAEDMGQRTDTFVRDNRWQVIGFAAVVGLAVGILARRPSSTQRPSPHPPSDPRRPPPLA